jgi:hypothetical protein
MGKEPPSFWAFFDWFYNNAQANGGSLNLGWIGTDGENQSFTVNWVPVGNVLPLLLMVLVYAIILFVKRKKAAQL